jgi:hypothetical protein
MGECVKSTTDAYEKELFLKGRDGKALCTDDSQITLGDDNRAFVLVEPNDSTSANALKKKYLGGTLTFDVNMSGVGCNCAAGVFLVALDDEQCMWDNYSSTNPPQCATFDVMEANNSGFNTASHPCANGQCDPVSQCMSKAREFGGMAYGPGSNYKINTTKSYQVMTKFFADTDNNLKYIDTLLIQGEEIVLMKQECGEYF